MWRALPAAHAPLMQRPKPGEHRGPAQCWPSPRPRCRVLRLQEGGARAGGGQARPASSGHSHRVPALPSSGPSRAISPAGLVLASEGGGGCAELSPGHCPGTEHLLPTPAELSPRGAGTKAASLASWGLHARPFGSRNSGAGGGGGALPLTPKSSRGFQRTRGRVWLSCSLPCCVAP